MTSIASRLDALEPIVMAQAGMLEKSVYGIVDKVVDGVPHFIRRWKGTIGKMVATEEEPTIFIAEKLEPIILKHKKYKCLFGGRAGTKSRAAFSIMTGEVNSCGSKVYVLRERMKSLRESVFAGIQETIKGLGMGGFLPVPSQWEIRHKSEGKFTFGGMSNIIDMKGSFNYKFFLMDESARTKQATIDTLGPTLRGIEGAELWYIWNPESANDPMSLEYIAPYQADLDRQGYYEDDYHLIIKIGFEDNPWFWGDKDLSDEYVKDKKKVDDGQFGDDIDNGIITADWFDACIDAHKKLGFDALGGIVSTCDPSDVGDDPTGFTQRKGVVFQQVLEIPGIDGNRKFDESCRLANESASDVFGWDCDGMGALLRDQAKANFDGKKTHTFMYKGSESVHDPNAIFGDAKSFSINESKKNKDVFRNKKAQNIVAFAGRCRRTYEAVVLGKYHDPDTLISFDSETISKEMMSKFRSETCKVPLKPGPRIEFYTKKELAAGILMPDGSRLKIPSPNLFDAAVLSFDKSGVINHAANFGSIQFDSIF
jgi:phage terminase large subunit